LRWYGPNNSKLTVGCYVKPAEVLKLVEKYFVSIPKGPEVKSVVVPPVQLDKVRYTTLVDNYARVSRFYASYPTIPFYHKDEKALDCLAEILGQGKTSLMYQNIVKTQSGLMASAFHSNSELAGEFVFILTPLPGKTLADMETMYRASLDSFEKRGVTDEDIAKFKGTAESDLIYGLQSVSGKVAQLAAYQTYTGNANKIADELKAIASLTKEDVMRVFQEYIKGKNSVVLSVVPKGQEQLIIAQNNFTIDSTQYKAPDYGYEGLKYAKAKDNFDRKKMPGNGMNPIVKVPPFWRKDLPNGIQMIGAENPELPVINFSLTIPGGHLLQANDLGKAGLAGGFAAMMNEDTKNYTAEQMTLELEKLGSSINVSSNVDGIIFNVQSLKKHFDKTLELLKERLFNPKFTEAAFSRLKKQSLESFKVSKSQPATVANTVFAKLNYGPNHILGISQNGTEETVQAITLQDIENYYNNYITSVGTKVVVVGNIKQAEVLPKLAFLDKLPKKKVELPKIDAAPKVDKTKVYMVDVPKAAQSEFRVGYATSLKYDATGDYYKAGLLNYTLGGDFNSRLNLNLREDKGWTYGARSSFNADEHAGQFQFSSGIKADKTDSALIEVMREFRELVASGPTADELAFMKSSIGQRDALRFETGAQKAAFIGRILEYNLPADYVDQQNKILKNITKGEIAGIGKKYLAPEKMNILLVGDKSKIYDGVKKLGYEIVELDADGKPAEKKAF
jgi:zinc protease